MSQSYDQPACFQPSETCFQPSGRDFLPDKCCFEGGQGLNHMLRLGKGIYHHSRKVNANQPVSSHQVPVSILHGAWDHV